MLNKEVTCVLCNKSVSIDNMRADKSAKGWICPNCYEKQHYKKPLKSITKDFRNVGMEYKTILDQQNMVKPKINIKQEKKEKYRCALCKFVSKQTSAAALCPNCGKSDILVRIQNTEELLKELEISPF
ncbi:hypothetical protein HYV88_05050 [Candidatus Woesearchaeota archaeon]|nr:hypothetical protein [Candidatus Woesearchaeota archaeon]